MTGRYPPIEPYDHGMLDVGAGGHTGGPGMDEILIAATDRFANR
jgi:hypothetical protein